MATSVNDDLKHLTTAVNISFCLRNLQAILFMVHQIILITKLVNKSFTLRMVMMLMHNALLMT